MNKPKINQIAQDIFIASKKEIPHISFIKRTSHNSEYPFLKKSSLIIPHKEAIKIINDLQMFYDTHSEKDIEKINRNLKIMIEVT